MSVLQRSDLFLGLAKTARSWQLVAFLLGAANVVLAGGFLQLALSTRLVPYLVEVDRSGEVRFAGPLEATSLPEERLLQAQLRGFVWDLRVVVNDPPAQAELLTRAYALASPELRRKLDRYYGAAENDPRQIAPRASRSIEAITLLRLPGSDNTYQAEWQEIEADRTGLGLARRRFFHGLLTVNMVRLEGTEALARNPLGLLITDFNWTETTLEEHVPDLPTEPAAAPLPVAATNP